MKTTRLRVTLRDVAPPVVRELDVPSAVPLAELHDLLQAGLGWTDSHLHSFEAGGDRYGVPDPDFTDPDFTDPDFTDLDDGLRDERSATLKDLPARFTYLYDFGDSWEHDVEVLGAGGTAPGCVGGEGACPPEDCGGVPGYAEFREAIADPAHPEHDHLRGWAGPWTDSFDRTATDVLVRATAGQVPASVRILLDLLDGGVKLTPGGRLPRAVVRAVQAERPHWYPLGRPASLEEDLLPLTVLHDLLRDAGLARLSRGVLTPTKAAGDDVQVVRRLRSTLEPGSFHDVLLGVASGHLAAHGPTTTEDLAGAVLPWLGHWAINGRPVAAEDLRTALHRAAPILQALDLARLDRGPRAGLWQPGPSATTLLPRATALAHHWRREAVAGT